MNRTVNGPKNIYTNQKIDKGDIMEYNKMEELVTKAGMSIIEALDADTKGPVRPDSERIYIIAGKSGADTSVQN